MAATLANHMLLAAFEAASLISKLETYGLFKVREKDREVLFLIRNI